MGEVRAAQDARRVKGCGISRVLETLDSADRDDLLTALADRNIEHTVIARVLTDRGYNIGRKTVESHRNGGCCRDH
jgi:hypothetical protein